MNIHNARRYIGDRLIRTAKPHRILDPAHGPLIAVRLNILTRKTLGGLETDLDSRVFGSDGQHHAGALCRRRSRRFRRRRHARLSLAGRHVSRRLPVFGPQCRTRGGEGGGIDDATAVDNCKRILRSKHWARPALSDTINIGGVARSFVAQLPDTKPAPLVIVLHGNTQTGADMMTRTSWPAVAKRERFGVVFPDGLNRAWADLRGPNAPAGPRPRAPTTSPLS